MAGKERTNSQYAFQSYHLVWLSTHPKRSADWLAEKMKDGFHIHHIDGDHSNDDPRNLLLIDGDDHMRLHGVSIEAGIRSWRRTSKVRKGDEDEAKRAYDGKASFVGTWAEFAKVFYDGEKNSPRPWTDIGSSLSNKARKHAARNNLAWPPQ